MPWLLGADQEACEAAAVGGSSSASFAWVRAAGLRWPRWLYGPGAWVLGDAGDPACWTAGRSLRRADIVQLAKVANFGKIRVTLQEKHYVLDVNC